MDLAAALAEIETLRTTTTELNGRLEAVAKNNEALLAEKRSVSEQKTQIEENARKTATELAKKNNDYEGIIKAHEDEKNAALERLTVAERRIADKEVNAFAKDIAHEMAFDSDSANAIELLIKNRLQYDEDEVKILSTKGSVALSLDEFKKEILSTPMFKYLLKQNQASGGRSTHATASGRSTTTNDNVKIPPAEKLNRARGV